MEFNKSSRLSKSQTSPGLKQEVGWHQATKRGARLPRKAGRKLRLRRGPEKNKHRLNVQCASIPEQGAFLEASSFHNKILRKAWISLNNPGGN